MGKVAIFTAPKPFVDPHITMIQRNAIMNWKALGDQVEIWLVGDEPGMKEAAVEFSVNHLPNVNTNSAGVPLIDSIFYLVRQSSSAELMCYVNTDILFLPDFLSAADALSRSGMNFLAVGQRWDVAITEPLVFNDGWPCELTKRIETVAKLHRPSGSDYFLFKRDDMQKIPPFSVGRAGWDNWMIFKGRQDKLAVVDCTKEITIIHQKHDYHHLADGKIHRLQSDSLDNVELAGGYQTMFQLPDTNYQLIGNTLKKKKMDRWRFARELTIFPLVTLKSNWLGKIFFDIFDPKQARKFKNRRRQIEKMKA